MYNCNDSDPNLARSGWLSKISCLNAHFSLVLTWSLLLFFHKLENNKHEYLTCKYLSSSRLPQKEAVYIKKNPGSPLDVPHPGILDQSDFFQERGQLRSRYNNLGVSLFWNGGQMDFPSNQVRMMIRNRLIEFTRLIEQKYCENELVFIAVVSSWCCWS